MLFLEGNTPEGGAEGRIIFESTSEGGETSVLGDFSIDDFMGQSFEEAPEPDVGNDAPASSPSGTSEEKENWQKELKNDEFRLMSREEMKDFVDSTRNINTTRKTEQVVKAFQRWLKDFCMEERAIETIDPEELDGFMCNYLVSKKKKDGTPHQADTLTSIHRAIVRHLKLREYQVDPMFHEAFEMSRDVLTSKRATLKKAGFGNKPNKAESFDDEEVDKMWDTGALGFADPVTLQYTVFWFLTIGFGLRGCDESKNMTWGDVILVEDKDEEEYLQWNERASKTRQGGDQGHTRAFAPKIYARKDDRCPVAAYKLFASKRPEKAMVEDAPFYLTVRQVCGFNDADWYLHTPMGINKLRKIVKLMCQKAGIPGRHTNHSLRKTCCQTLMANDVPPVLVAQLSGHKNLNSLNNYTVATKPQQRAMSEILTGKRSKPTSLSSRPAKRISSCRSEAMPADFGYAQLPPGVLPPAPVAVSLPRPHPYYMPVSQMPGAASSPRNMAMQQMQSSASTMFQGAHVTAPITMHFHYNVQSNSSSQYNASPSKKSNE